MATHDEVEERLDRLRAQTDGVGSPPGLEGRVLQRLRAIRRVESFWDVAFPVSLRAMPIAACAACVALALAFWQDGRLTDSLVLSAKAEADVEIRDP